MIKFIKAMLVGGSFIALLYTIQQQHIEINKLRTTNIESLTKTIDSLKSDIFVEHLIIDRYEITLERLREDNPEAAEEFEEELKNSE